MLYAHLGGQPALNAYSALFAHDPAGRPGGGLMELEKLFVRAARAAARHRRHGRRPTRRRYGVARGRLEGVRPGGCQRARRHRRRWSTSCSSAAEGHLVGTVGPRYFGFVIGGSTPAATAADMLAVGWDQNAFNPVLSPAAEAAERAAGGWVKDLLGLPDGASVGFVTGAQAANTVGIACGRHWVLEQAGLRRRDRRADRRTASPGRHGLRAARHHRPVAAAARARHGVAGAACSPTTRAPSTSTTWPASWRPSRSGRRSSACRPAT